MTPMCVGCLVEKLTKKNPLTYHNSQFDISHNDFSLTTNTNGPLGGARSS